jgi:hypothetical protein
MEMAAVHGGWNWGMFSAVEWINNTMREPMALDF